jgi:small-conductance mechanosensitive channel
MLIDPQHLLPALGLPGDPGPVLNLFVVMVLLWYTIKIPGLVGRFVSQSGRNTSFVGAVVRVVLKTAPLQQWLVARAMRQRVKARFDKEGIRIPTTFRTTVDEEPPA